MALSDADIEPMREAIAASRMARDSGNMPFGAALVGTTGEVLWVSLNNQVSTGDCTGHAELVLVREASAALGADVLRGSTVYASGEPCPMCSGAMFWAGVARVVYAATQADITAALGEPQLGTGAAQILSHGTPAVQVDGPLLREEAKAQLAPPRSTILS